MFCPRCGRNLNGDEDICPECGNILRGSPAENNRNGGSGIGPYVFFAVGFLAMLVLIYFVGFYFVFLFVPLLFGGKRQSRTYMLLAGAMLGTCVGLVCRVLL